MIEVAVAIGVVAILAGAVAPLAVKALNQQREQKTRENLKTAYEALFGSRDRRLSNMRADFGFNPGALADLRLMTTRTSVPAAQRPPVYGASAEGFSWGWNGPYWTGPVQPLAGVAGGLPADGWGRALRVALVTGGWQVQSAGVNGTFGNVDDLVFPQSPLTPTAMSATLAVNVFNRTASDLTRVELRIRSRAQQPGLPAEVVHAWTNPVPVGTSHLFGTATIGQPLPGPLRVSVTAQPAGSTESLVMDLLPGESRTLDLNVH